MIGFEFSGGPGFNTNMQNLIGKEGIIISCPTDDICYVEFENKERWSYPYPEILDHLVEDKSIEEIINNMKQLIQQI